jgi:bla regulator protein BlaR1
MIPTYLLPLANHLWQSTLFAGVAGLIALALRRNRASLRHGLWLTASVKFLVPFSVLIGLGSQLQWRAAPAISQTPLSSWMGEISQPFAPPPAPLLAAVPQAPAPSQIPTLLFGVWLCGFAVATCAWLREWLRVRAAVRTASPLDPPIDRISIRVMSSPALLEPCVFGILRPVLLLPRGIKDRLTPDQLKAILLHELCHVRRRDNLAAALHMVVETLFWFCPLVYWIGKRLMDERETACDEEVLRTIGEPEVYAHGILAVRRFCLQSAPVCAAGVTGSNLKKRIEGIMRHRTALQLDFSRKLLLVLAAITSLAGPIAVGVIDSKPGRAQSDPTIRPAFEVASVKITKEDGGTGPRNFRRSYGPQGIDFGGLTLGFIIGDVYQMPANRIVGSNSRMGEALKGPPGYDIVARADHAVSKEQLRLMVQSLLADRFKLTMHRETRTGPVYKLVVAKGGPKLEESDGGDLAMSGSPDGYAFRNSELLWLAAYLSGRVDRMVVDETGLKGVYNFAIKLPEDLRQNQPAKSESGSADRPPGSLFADELKKLGLQLIAATAPVEYLVINHVERPSEN